MALSVPSAPRARARAARTKSFDRRTGRKLLPAFLLARTSLMVLAGRVSVNAECVGRDRHRAEHGYKPGRRLDVLFLAGSTEAVTGQHCFLVIGQDEHLAAVIAARKAITDEVDTASRPTNDPSLQQQRMPTLSPRVQQACPAVRDYLGSPGSPLWAEQGRLLGISRAASAVATRTMTGTLVLTGVIGLLGVSGAAASIAHSVTGPVRRAVRVLQPPAKGRRGHRFRPTTLHQLRCMARVVDTAGDELLGTAREIRADARSLSMASEGSTAMSGPPSSAEASPAPAGVTVAVGAVPQAQPVALDATIASARSGGADTGCAVIARSGQEAAKGTDAVTAASAPTEGPVTTNRYAAARSRALGPTTALWHAVALDRLVGASGDACEITVCGSLVRVSGEQRWPVPARDVCPACSTLAH